MSMSSGSLEIAVEAIAAGKPVVVVDDDDRENEGDVLVAAELVTADHLNFMLSKARGIVCVPLPEARLRALEIPDMVTGTRDGGTTAFTVTVDLAHPNTSGTSVADRVSCIRHLMREEARPEDLARPGHVMPLRAHPHGLVGRRGHTEAAVELTRLAGLSPGGVICEVLNDDGSMARGADLVAFAESFRIPILRMDQIARHLADASGEIGLPVIL